MDNAFKPVKATDVTLGEKALPSPNGSLLVMFPGTDSSMILFPSWSHVKLYDLIYIYQTGHTDNIYIYAKQVTQTIKQHVKSNAAVTRLLQRCPRNL